MPTCRLCNQEKSLIKSHIIPEFFYEGIYEHRKHRFRVLHSDPDKSLYWRQKGIYEKLLCNECDNHRLGTFDKYAREAVYGTQPNQTTAHWKRINRHQAYARLYPQRARSIQPSVDDLARQYVLIENVDYKKFRLFQLSILWRAGISSDTMFSQVNLGVHEENIRNMLIQESEPQPEEYSCFLISASYDGGFATDFMTDPIRLKIDGHTFYRFIFGGIVWLFKVSSHAMNTKFSLMMHRTNDAFMFVKEMKDMENIVKFASDLAAMNRLPT